MKRESISKGDLMKLIYTEEELKNIDPATPIETWDECPSIHHVMNYNSRILMGKLENLFDVAEERGINLNNYT